MSRTFDDLNDERDRIFVKIFSRLGWIFTAYYFFVDYAAGATISYMALGFSTLVLIPLGLWLFNRNHKLVGRLLVYFALSFDQYTGYLSYGPQVHTEYWLFSIMASTFLVIDPEERRTLYLCVALPMISWGATLFGRDFLPDHLKVHEKVSELDPALSFLSSALLCIVFINIFVNMMIRLKQATVKEEEEKRQKIQRYHQELEQSRASIIHTSKLSSLGEMASGIAHEINNPLAIIELNAISMRRYLEKKIPDDQKVNKNLTDIENTVRRISKIITGLRVISRKDSKRDFISVPVRTILEDVLGLCQEKFRVHDIQLIVDDEKQIMDEELLCQQVQLSQVFINLLNNAYDAVIESQETPKWIRLSFSRTEDHLHIRVSNSGQKISDDVASRLFEPFFTTKEIGKGTGIGLSISKNIIEDHRGHIFLDQTAPNTSFIINLPLEAKEYTFH